MAQMGRRKKILYGCFGALLLALSLLAWRYAPINFVGSNPRIDALIEKLASESPLPVFERSPPSIVSRQKVIENPGDWNPLAQKSVSHAYYELRSMGKEAFPYLINHFGDDRYSHERSSASFYEVSVGLACKYLIDGQLDVCGPMYKSRETPNGNLLGCDFDEYVRSQFGSYAAWWRLNRNLSLREMRIATVEWRIQREKEFGFVAKEENSILSQLAEALSKANEEYEPPKMPPPDVYRWIVDELAYDYICWQRAKDRRNKAEEK